VLSFSEALHEEVKGQGVTVSALCPGPTATEFGEVAGFSRSLPGMIFADSPSVVSAGLKGLRAGRAIVIPGLMNKSTAQAHRFFPRSWVRKAAGMLKP
jgi:short-subunit dehydrogenase